MTMTIMLWMVTCYRPQDSLKMRIMMISLTTMMMTMLITMIMFCMATGHLSPQRVYEELSVDCRIWRAALLLGQKHKDKTQTRLTKLQIKTSNIVCKAKTNKQCLYWPFDFKNCYYGWKIQEDGNNDNKSVIFGCILFAMDFILFVVAVWFLLQFCAVLGIRRRGVSTWEG